MEKQVSQDVFIPSIVSVGQLAKLLDVSLGIILFNYGSPKSYIALESLQQKMWESGMGDQLSYDHSLCNLRISRLPS